MRSGDIASEGTLSPIPLPTDFNIAGQAQGDVMYFNGTNWVVLAAGTADQSLRTKGAAANPVWENVNNATNLSISGETTGDIIYYNGANWVRLAGGTSGDVLTGNGAGVAPTYQTPAAGDGLSNVIFSWSGVDNATASSAGMYSGTNLQPGTAAGEGNSIVYVSGNLRTMMNFQWTKISSVSTVTLHARFWGESTDAGEQAQVRAEINALGVTLENLGTTPTWITPATINVSSLTNGVVYDGIIQVGNNNGSHQGLCSAVMLIGS